MEPREAVESGAAQDSVDGGAGDAQPPPDAVWPPGEHASCSADGRFLQLIGLAGAAQGDGWSGRGARPIHLHGNRRIPTWRRSRGRRGTSGPLRPGASQPTPVLTNSARVTGVKRALRWVMRGLLALLVLVHTTATARSLTCQQPLWELQLAGADIAGLSPRVRGNPAREVRGQVNAGSIPACAGEPCWVCPAHSAMPVYPACAGEPARARPGLGTARVYPRVCGGTTVAHPRVVVDAGLSPRVRGNPVVVVIVQDDHRSIPACAGEP